jgi:uncharacterized protein (TIGR02284 family)
MVMAERTARAIVNDLIETCRDGARGFQTAASLVKDSSLAALLRDLADERCAFAAELEPHAQRLGGETAAQGTAKAALHRSWMDLKSVLTSRDDQAVMTEVRRGDAATLRLFDDAIAGPLPPSIRDVIEVQGRRIRADHARIEEVMRTVSVHTTL